MGCGLLTDLQLSLCTLVPIFTSQTNYWLGVTHFNNRAIRQVVIFSLQEQGQQSISVWDAFLMRQVAFIWGEKCAPALTTMTEAEATVWRIFFFEAHTPNCNNEITNMSETWLCSWGSEKK